MQMSDVARFIDDIKQARQYGTSIGGAIVDSSEFPWGQHKARFKRLNEPDPSYHVVVYTETLAAT